MKKVMIALIVAVAAHTACLAGNNGSNEQVKTAAKENGTEGEGRSVGHYLRRGGDHQEPHRGEHTARPPHHQQERRRQRLVHGHDRKTCFRQERNV